MSERDVSNLSFATWVLDFERLVETQELEQFATIGICSRIVSHRRLYRAALSTVLSGMAGLISAPRLAG